MRLLSLLLVVGCTGDNKGKKGSGEDIDTSLDTADTIAEPDFCADQGLTVRDFDATGTSGDFGEVVPDFSWAVRDGQNTPSTWTFSEQWSGCDTYMIINYYGDSNYPVEMDNRREIREWLESSPLNTRYIFFSYDQEPDAVLDDLIVEIEDAIDDLDDALAAHWRARIHYATESPWDADWVGGLNNAYYVNGEYVQWALSIDRFGVAREIGSFCDPATGWEQCPPEFMIYEPQYYNFESDRDEVLQAEADGVTVLDVWVGEGASDPGWAGQRIYAEVALPDAATMATFDTMGFDLTLECAGYPARTECPAWDYLVYAYLCDVDDPETKEDESTRCSTEIGRWITTYWRPGRWVHDVTPFLGMLQDGGTRKLAFYTQQYYDVSLSIRLSNQGKGYRPVAMEPLFTGGRFDSEYNWGVHHEISETQWRVWSHDSDDTTYTIGTVDAEAGYLTAEGPRGWSRLDWTAGEDGLHYCHTAEGEGTEEDAAAAVFSCVEDDPKTKEDESSCSGANPEDLEAGCNEGGWAALEGSTATSALWGTWQEVWHEGKLPKAITPPEGTARVGLTAVISGHGFGDTTANCAEFCDHQHEFTINGASAYTKTHPEAGSRMGCAEQVVDGTVPNQSGTWVYGRGGWCPGMEVQPWEIDITDDLTVGTENEISYLGLMGGDVWKPGSTGARIDMQSYIVYYE